MAAELGRKSKATLIKPAPFFVWQDPDINWVQRRLINAIVSIQAPGGSGEGRGPA